MNQYRHNYTFGGRIYHSVGIEERIKKKIREKSKEKKTVGTTKDIFSLLLFNQWLMLQHAKNLGEKFKRKR